MALLKGRFKKAAFSVICFSVLSLAILLLLVTNYFSSNTFPSHYHHFRSADFYSTSSQRPRSRRLWGPVSSLEGLHPFAKPRGFYPAPAEENGYIYAKIHGGLEMIQSSICDLVTVSRLLNATLVIPEIQATTRSKGISPKFKSFSYLYDEEHFISALSSDITIVRTLPKDLKETRKKTKFPTFSPKSFATPDFYFRRVLPRLKQRNVIGLIITDGGCIESILPAGMDEYQRLRCRVAFHALQFRSEIRALGNQIIERLRSSGRPYLVYHPGLVREKLAFQGCGELFQDIHTELIQYRRNELIKQGKIKDAPSVDSEARKKNGLCPLMPEEVGLVLRAIGYPPGTILYLAGSETFGGQRILIPLRAMYSNLADRTSLCTKHELSALLGPEPPLPSNMHQYPSMKNTKELVEDWKNAGPRPRPLPPPPARPIYSHEKEGWYGWIAETDQEPDPSPTDLRMKAHMLIWDALDFYVAVEADAFFPGFHNDGSGLVDYSSLIMGHRLYQSASGITYRPDRKTIVQVFGNISNHLYYMPRNLTLVIREHLNKTLGMDGLVTEARSSKPISFLSHPLPECSCRATSGILADHAQVVKDDADRLLFGGEAECPEWLVNGLAMVSTKASTLQTEDYEGDLLEDQLYGSEELDNLNKSSEQDEEMDPDD